MTHPAERVVHPASVILCSRGRPAMLRETVASILGGGSLPAELIVVDQSAEPDAGLAEPAAGAGCALRYLHSRSTGLSRANNEGVAAARHDVLVFTHDDILVAPDWLDRLLAALGREGGRAVVTGRVLAADETPGGFAPALKTDPRPARYEGRVGYDVLKPMNMAMPRAALAEVGGFDERLGPGTPFPGAEDSDLGFRLLEAGWRIVYAPEAVLWHRAWRPAADFLPLRWAYGTAQGAFYAKHLRLRDPHMLVRFTKDLARRVRRFPLRLVREGREALADPVFIAGNLAGAARWTMHRTLRRRSP